MAKLSKFVKVDKNVLLEYVYDDENNIGESYEVLVNSKDRRQSYFATSTSGTNNTLNNSLFVLDKVSNKYGKINTSQYSFLQTKSYSSSTPITHDKLIVHLPINWTFGEYLGFYVKIFAYDVLNQTSYDLSNYYFDMTDSAQSYMLNFTSPPLLFAEKLWGKNLTIEFPSVSAIASQRVNNRPKESSLNANLTNGSGFSLTTPVFIDFHFINNIQTINAVTSYLLNPKVSVSVPQTPEFENLGLKIEHSPNGDYFEIYGTYNGTIAGFKQFIDDSFVAGSRYYVQYSITTFEQNVRGKTITAEVIDNFNETIEFRPIIKASTTTAIIDVEMRLIDAVTESTIMRRASYGMLQDEVSRYSLNLIKINLKNANKPKIYNTKLNRPIETKGIEDRIRNIQNKNKGLGPVKNKTIDNGVSSIQFDPTITGLISTGIKDIVMGAFPTMGTDQSNLNLVIQKIASEVARNLSGGTNPVGIASSPPATVEYQFFDKKNVTVKIDGNAEYDAQGQGLIVIDMTADTIAPINFLITDGPANEPKNLSRLNDILLVFSDARSTEKIPESSYRTSGASDLDRGLVYFEINDRSKQNIRKFYDGGNKNFSIVGVSNGKEFQIYRGVFELSDSKTMLAQNEAIIKAKLDKQKEQAAAALNGTPNPSTKSDPSNTAAAAANSGTTGGTGDPNDKTGNAPKKKG
jgi:hypothetical protein